MRIAFHFSFLLIIFLMGCSGGGTSDDDVLFSEGLGSFSGNLQVVDVPQNNLGFINNATVNFSRLGDTFTMTVSGDEGFNRVFEGTITGEGANSSFLMSLERQISPVEKPADGALSIANNIASIEIQLMNDALTLTRLDGNSEEITFELTGNIRIGANINRRQ